MTNAIAIVGMACLYPDARTPVELWENMLAQRRSFRRIPSERLNLDDYMSPDRSTPDHIYSTEAALIEGYEFDRVRFRVAGSTFRTADMVHWLALDIAARALEDAGFGDAEGLPKESTGVLLGNTLTGEFSRANTVRLRWPYVRRTVEAALIEQGWSSEQRSPFLQSLETQFKAPFPDIGEESLAGGLSNTIAGRICNYFDLNGGGYTVDGACASSLLAITNACSSLVVGDLDVAIAGGVDLSLDPFELVGFAKTGALAPEEMRVYDAHSAGFWPGEGCGFVVLMRHADAVAQQCRIYATIQGWGVSSDGSGGITRPEVEGQLLAVQRAYRRAGFGVDTVAYFEGHGTGTAVGDATELRMLSRARKEANPTASPAVIGSVKANIGHTKAAAGVAGLIKATMALHTQTLPPTTGCQTPHALFTEDSPALRVLPRAESWSGDAALRAGVSAMGFGGINSHVVLEGEPSEYGVARARKMLDSRTQTLRTSAQDAELYLFSSDHVTELEQQIEHLLTLVPKISLAEMADLAVELQRTLTTGRVRAAIMATTPTELVNRLQMLHSWLQAGTIERLDMRQNVFLGSGTHAPRLGFLFPGQGTRAYADGGALGRRFPFVQDLFVNQQGLTQEVSTEVAQPAIIRATVAALRVLECLDLRACVAVGHSLGELSALHWAEVLDEQSVLRIAARRGRIMADLGNPTGTMAHIAANRDSVKALLNGGPVTIACLNSPNRIIISGEATAITKVIAKAQASGLNAGNIPVSHAFHSPLIAAAAQPLAEYLASEEFHPIQHSVVSTVTGDFLTQDDDLCLLLHEQVTAPVRFTEAVTKAAVDVDLLVEVGPGRVLSGLARECVDTPVVTIDAGGSSLQGLLHTAGAAFALGAPLNHGALFDGRFTRPFDLTWQPRFFVNPCELAPKPEDVLPNGSPNEFDVCQTKSVSTDCIEQAIEPVETNAIVANEEDILTLVRRLVAERAELPIAAIRNEDRLLSELHLNSITVSQLVVEVARHLNLAPPVAPTEYADVTVATIAGTMAELARSGVSTPIDDERRLASGVDTWVRPFTVEMVERPRPRRQSASDVGNWQVITPSEYPLAEPLHAAFVEASGCGVVVCLPPQSSDQDLGLLLQGVQVLFATQKADRFVLVQHGRSAAALARTLHLESPHITTCVVDVPADHAQATEWVVSEAMSATGYVEAHYDNDGRRFEPSLRLLPLETESASLPLSTDDVLLVTGGGKGITAECALSLARTSGARLALLGRSQPAEDAELATNLERMDAAGIDFVYIATDITDAQQVQEAVQQVEQRLGPVTGILHGAARNVPQLLHSLDEATFQRTMAPKLQGARNLLAAIDPQQLRLLVTFGSIIARTGLPGEADYGLANEWLTALTGDVQRQYPACRCLAVEWSVWSGAGMGDRLGRLDALARQGITPIPLEEGVAMLHRLLAQGERGSSTPTAVVVTGRFGTPPTLRVEQPEISFWRFLEEVQVHYPSVELVVDAKLSLDTDPYLDDHVFQGERLLPAVMGLEAMAQAAMTLVNVDKAPLFEDVTFERPVVVPEGTPVTIRLAALVRAPGQVEVVLRSEETAFQADHFRAICRFDVADTDSAISILESEAGQLPAVAIDPQRQLYGGILFHNGRFQRLQGYRHVAAKACVAEISAEESSWFGRYLPPELVLADPGARDATIHAIQVCVPHATLLPIGVERLIPATPSSSGPRFVHAKERAQQGDIFTYDVDVTDAEGRLHERWQGLRLHMVGNENPTKSWPTALWGPYLERQLETLWPEIAVHVAMTQNARVARRIRSDLTIQRALGKAVQVQRRPDGKPEIPGNQTVSVAHADDLTLAVAGPGTVGCDLEPVVARPEVIWRDLLGTERFQAALLVSREANESLDSAATRIWAANESLKKAGMGANAPLTLTSTKADGWVLFSAGRLAVATLVLQMGDMQEEMVLAVAADVDQSKKDENRQSKYYAGDRLSNETESDRYHVIPNDRAVPVM